MFHELRFVIRELSLQNLLVIEIIRIFKGPLDDLFVLFFDFIDENESVFGQIGVDPVAENGKVLDRHLFEVEFGLFPGLFNF